MNAKATTADASFIAKKHEMFAKMSGGIKSYSGLRWLHLPQDECLNISFRCAECNGKMAYQEYYFSDFFLENNDRIRLCKECWEKCE
jgi:hypothetical protein